MAQDRFRFVKRFLMEIPAVLVAVLLALALSSWKEKMDRDEKSKLVLSYITTEVEDNYRVIQFVDSLSYPALEKFSKSIESFENGERDDVPSTLIIPTIQNVAWEMAKTSDVFSNFSPEVVTNIAAVYQEQKRTEAIFKSLDEFRIKQNPEMSVLNVAKYKRNHLESLLSRYADLKRRYEEYLHVNN